LQLSSTANDQLQGVTLGLASISLTSQSGNTVSLLATPQSIEFIHLNGMPEPLVTVSVPRDVYTSASVTTSGANFVCASLLPTGGLQSSFFASSTKPSTVTMTSPITITGAAMVLDLDLQVSPSVTFSDCNLADNPTVAVTPTFNLTPVAIAAQPTNAKNGKLRGIDGQVASINTSANSFTMALPDGQTLNGGALTGDSQTLTVLSGPSTPFEGVSSLAALTVGMFVDADLAIQSDGSLLATRVAVEDPTAADVISGPLMQISNAQPSFISVSRQSQGKDYPYTTEELFASFASTLFQVSGQFSNLQSLPFTPSFGGSNIVPGQNVYVSTDTIALSGRYPYTPAITMTLMPQTINGTVNAIGSSGGFTTYTITLAPYDFFPALAVQPGQATLLSNPNTVVVYADSDTQMLNSTPITAGSTMRFNGLVFNDNGTLRMDCGQVNDGVPE
jgi:hypothetical protein